MEYSEEDGAGEGAGASVPAVSADTDQRDAQDDDVPGPSAPKRKKKTTPFTKEELRCMVEGLVQHAEVLFGSKERKTPLRTKNALWSAVAEKVSAVGVAPRTAAELKKRWQDLKVRTRRKVSDHRKEQMGTGGGTVPELELYEWEISCLSLMDSTATDGVGDVDYGAQDDTEEPGVSAPSSQNQGQDQAVHVRRKTHTPHQTQATVIPQTPRTPQSATTATPAAPAQPPPTASTQSGQEQEMETPPSPLTHPHSPLHESTGLSEEQQTVLLDLTPVSTTPLSPIDSESVGDNEVVHSPNAYDIPEVPLPEPVSAGVQVLQSILDRLTALETTHRAPTENDSAMSQALGRLATRASCTNACLQGLHRQLVRSDRARKAEAKQSVVALTALTKAVAAQTEQQRLSGVAVTNAIAEQTLALQQMHATAAIPAQSRPPTCSSPSTNPSSGPASTCTSPQPEQQPRRGPCRQRGGKRGHK